MPAWPTVAAPRDSAQRLHDRLRRAGLPSLRGGRRRGAYGLDALLGRLPSSGFLELAVPGRGGPGAAGRRAVDRRAVVGVPREQDGRPASWSHREHGAPAHAQGRP